MKTGDRRRRSALSGEASVRGRAYLAGPHASPPDSHCPCPAWSPPLLPDLPFSSKGTVLAHLGIVNHPAQSFVSGAPIRVFLVLEPPDQGTVCGGPCEGRVVSVEFLPLFRTERRLRGQCSRGTRCAYPCHRYAIISRQGRVRSQHQNEQKEASVRRSARPLGTLLGSCSVLPL
jgi:hypothetical protein